MELSSTQQQIIVLSALAYILGVPPSKLANEVLEDSIVIKNKYKRLVQRAFTAETFCKCERERVDTVLATGRDEENHCRNVENIFNS